MNKKIVQDVVSKRSIRNVPVHPKTSKKDDPIAREREQLIERLMRKNESRQEPRKKEVVEDEPEGYVAPKQKPKKKKKNHSFKVVIGAIATLFVAFIAFSVTVFLAGATISVTPKHATVPINSNLSAFSDASSTPAVLPYQVIVVSATDSESIPATTAVASVDKKASGTIIIYNNYSSGPQTLVSNTRFQTESGLIYRIRDTVLVPGVKVTDGKSVPGSLEAVVTADQPGSQYNIGLSDFTVPGFKDDPQRSTKIFARSKTSMTGGSSKTDAGVSAADLKTAQNTMEDRLREKLLRDARAKKPTDSVLYDSAMTFDFEMLPQTKKDESTVSVNEKGTLHVVLLNKKLLSRAILGNSIAAVGNEVEVRGVENLTFTPQQSGSTKPIWQRSPLQFVITGSVDIVGIVDKDKLLIDLQGKPRGNLQSVLSNYPTIEKANAVIRPFWKKSFPLDPNKIKIEITASQ